MASALRVAAIGAGGGAAAHFAAAALTDAVDFVGVLDVDAARAQAQAARYGIGRCYADLDELLADESAACVAVLTPPDTHEALTCAALAAGRHVVCEKPLGRTVEECDRMLDAAAAAARRLLPVHNRVYSHALTRVHELVSTGELGSLFLAESVGVESPATVDAAAWLRTDVSLGGVVIAQATFAAAPGSGDHAIRLFGTAGTVETTLRGGTHERPERLHAVRRGDAELRELPLPPSEGWITSFQRMWEDYAHAILTDAPARVSAEDGREVVRIVRAAYDSMREGRAVAL